MKLASLIFLVGLPLLAQNPPAPHVVPNGPPPRPRLPAPAPPENGPESAAQENLSLRLSGRWAGAGLDSTVTGVGPVFSFERAVGEDGGQLHCELRVLGGDAESTIIAYTLGMRAKVMTSPQTYEYRDISTSGAVRCRPGKPVDICRHGDETLTLSLSSPGE